MKLHSPALQRAYDRFQQRRAAPPDGMAQSTASRQHPELKLAYITVGRSTKGMLYFKIRYCPNCLRGTVLDMVGEPPSAPDAHDLGIRRSRDWSLDCRGGGAAGR